MKKIFGYVFLLLGLALIVINIEIIKTKLPFTIPATIQPLYITIAGVVLIALGAFFLFQGRGAKQSAEVPIYRGKEIVGYRRHK